MRGSANGFVSEYLLHSLKVGDVVKGSGPCGEMYQRPYLHGKRLVFIAGGSGITPFASMLATDEAKSVTDKSIDLIYGCAKEDDIIFADCLKAWEAKGLVRVHPIISEPSADCPYRTGFITAEAIREIVGDVSQCTFFLCGPSAMYNFVVPSLESMGIPRSRIRQEVQTMPADPTKLPGWPVSITSQNTFTIRTSDGRSFPAKATETVLTAMERHGIVVPTQCRSGECSACRTKLVAGTVYHSGNELLRKADMKTGYMHPCVTYPLSDLEIML